MERFVFADEHNCDRTYVLYADAQATVEALRRERDQAEQKHLQDVAYMRSQYDSIVAMKDEVQAALDAERQQHTQLLALVRAAVTRWRAQINVKEGVSFRMAMKALEATLDATTPTIEQEIEQIVGEAGNPVWPKGGDGE